MPDDDLRSNLGEIAAFVAGAGGLDAIAVLENPDRQMGSEHIVDVGVADSATSVSFSVLQSGGRYLVLGGEQPEPTHEETTDPNERPALRINPPQSDGS